MTEMRRKKKKKKRRRILPTPVFLGLKNISRQGLLTAPLPYF
jgi:hypothetical protein